MELRVINGNLTLDSVFRLIVIGSIFSFGALVGVMMLIVVLVMLLTGDVTVNGEVIQGRVKALLEILPALLFFPVYIVVQAFSFAIFLSFGLWLYRLKHPLRVIIES
ncbi:MAG: hypothetical protein JKY46_01015 [Robiginitomaculum sp.]|nr:hypothetical protein [Robiginitomaculum sp.]